MKTKVLAEIKDDKSAGWIDPFEIEAIFVDEDGDVSFHMKSGEALCTGSAFRNKLGLATAWLATVLSIAAKRGESEPLVLIHWQGGQS